MVNSKVDIRNVMEAYDVTLMVERRDHYTYICHVAIDVHTTCDKVQDCVVFYYICKHAAASDILLYKRRDYTRTIYI